MPTEVANFIWADTTLFASRYEKSTCALIALKQAIERHKLLAMREQEFLNLYEAISVSNPDDFTRVWSDPTAYFWVRIAYELLKTYLTGEPLSSFAQDYCKALGQPDVEEALHLHLGEFKKFVLGVYYLSEKDCLFSEPFIPYLPLAIPGTRLFLVGEDTLKINGLLGGKLKVSYAEQESFLELKSGSSLKDDSLKVGECPIVKYKNCQLPLQPYSFNLPGVEDGQPVVAAGIAYQEKHANLVQETLALVERCQPKTFAQLESFLQILAFKPLKTGSYSNLTHSDLPGAFICSVIESPYELADTLIHEFHHNRLFFIEEIAPLLINSDNGLELLVTGQYYSPWRNDLRPLRGLLHAVYVYLPVSWFWLAVYQDDELSNRPLDYVCSQLIRIPLQLKIAVYQLERSAHWTEEGIRLFTELKADVIRLTKAISDLGISYDVPALICREDGSLVKELRKSDGKPLNAQESVLDHIYCYDIHNQCQDILQDLALV